jgi:hypothetical protein
MHVKDRLLRRDPAGLLAVRNGIALNESTGKLFECGHLLLGLRATLEREPVLSFLSPTFRG